jgi:hypothetical protein
MPTFAFVTAPPCLTTQLLRCYNAPLPDFHLLGFGGKFYARVLSAQNHSTSELLRTL